VGNVNFYLNILTRLQDIIKGLRVNDIYENSSLEGQILQDGERSYRDSKSEVLTITP